MQNNAILIAFFTWCQKNGIKSYAERFSRYSGLYICWLAKITPQIGRWADAKQTIGNIPSS